MTSDTHTHSIHSVDPKYSQRNNRTIPIYIQQDATLLSLFCLETALHVSGGTITHHQERKQLYLQHLVFVTPLLPSATIVEELEQFQQFQLFHDSGRWQ